MSLERVKGLMVELDFKFLAQVGVLRLQCHAASFSGFGP